MKPLIALSAILSLGLLSACATPTPYTAALTTADDGFHPGYTDTRLEDDRYRIGFAGNEATSRDTVENYLLYHAAELTLNAGYDWFEIVKTDTDKKTRTIGDVDDPLWGGMSWRFYRGHRWGGWGFDNEFETTEYSRYQATAEIILHKGAKPDGNAHAYDARQLKQNLESKIVRPTPSK